MHCAAQARNLEAGKEGIFRVTVKGELQGLAFFCLKENHGP
jgi:hypothetical protein